MYTAHGPKLGFGVEIVEIAYVFMCYFLPSSDIVHAYHNLTPYVFLFVKNLFWGGHIVSLSSETCDTRLISSHGAFKVDHLREVIFSCHLGFLHGTIDF